MNILVDKNVRILFVVMLSAIGVFLINVSLVLVLGKSAVWVFVLAFCMALVIVISFVWYFRKQNMIIGNAIQQITNYLSGDKEERIDCDYEGELYKLFHSINLLASVLNAHAQKELSAKEFLKNTISDISHQLKTPLAALNVYNGILQEEAAEMPQILKFCTLSEHELDRIETLVQNLLKITKLDAGTIVIHKKRENLSEMLEGILQQFSFRAMQEQKTMTCTGEKDIFLLCDKSWLSEAIGNLVKNALDHTSQGDEINIIYKRLPSVIQIIIEDTGRGISPDDIHHIFKRFYRSRLSQDTQGIGLGLPLAKTIIEAQDGSIEVDSKLGVGTRFIINFLIPTKL